MSPAAATEPVSFFLPEGDLDRLESLDPDRTPAEFQTAERAWTLQTYLRLRRAGLPVTLVDTVADRGVVVFHAKHKHEVQRFRVRSRDAVLVALRGDRNPVLTSDFEIVQNGLQADGRRTFDVPHWPQPGLVPRDPSRGTVLRVAAYKGFAGNLEPGFTDGRWQARLAAAGIEWRCDAVPFDREAFRRYEVDWSSYRDVDAIVAVRPLAPDLHAGKPASKLVNAWLAGVPAVLGPECASRALRRSPNDYLEAASADEAAAALLRLRDEPGLMAAMIEKGRERAEDYRLDRLVDLWQRLLFETLPRAAGARRRGRRRSLVTLTAASWLRRLGASIAS